MSSQLQCSQSFHSFPGVLELKHHKPSDSDGSSKALSHTFIHDALVWKWSRCGKEVLGYSPFFFEQSTGDLLLSWSFPDPTPQTSCVPFFILLESDPYTVPEKSCWWLCIYDPTDNMKLIKMTSIMDVLRGIRKQK